MSKGFQNVLGLTLSALVTLAGVALLLDARRDAAAAAPPAAAHSPCRCLRNFALDQRPSNGGF